MKNTKVLIKTRIYSIGSVTSVEVGTITITGDELNERGEKSVVHDDVFHVIGGRELWKQLKVTHRGRKLVVQ